MKHPSRWSNKYARRGALLLATVTVFPIGLVFGAGMGMMEVTQEWVDSFNKVWRRSNDES